MKRLLTVLCAAGLWQGVLHAEDVVIYRPQLDDAPRAPRAVAVALPAAAVPALPVPDPAPVEAKAVSEEALPATHRVAKGETLFSIAKRYQLPVADLREANGYQGTPTLRVGQVVKLPSARAVAVAAPAPAAVPAKSAAAELAAPTQLAYQRKFIDETRAVAKQGVSYNERWMPSGLGLETAKGWVMDCSNTARYLYKKVAGIDLPRTASDQYAALKEKGLAWTAPKELDALEQKLEVGDMLFWENTYNSHRNPPVTHVMIYLGKNKKGEWLMAGSQQGSGFYNTSGSGPDIYVFKPNRAAGGYSTNLGFTHVKGRFRFYGRPLLQKDTAPTAELASR
ncbi:MAG: LysM peptidoglycan-binding domain-containing protein [Verrucomicrobium sp.]|nr:LysM peptidoglycan-binding domain-containing protein [Verrucomicrobium sp.]